MVPLLGQDGLPVLNEGGGPILVPYVEHEYSDTLLIFLLKGGRPERYRENYHAEDASRPPLNLNVNLNGVTIDLRNASAAELSRLPREELLRLHRETLGLQGED